MCSDERGGAVYRLQHQTRHLVEVPLPSFTSLGFDGDIALSRGTKQMQLVDDLIY